MVNIQKVDNAIVFSFSDSDFYLYGTGSISVPLNSLSLYIDESDMITYKKANSNDIFVSVPIDQTNFSSKADAIDFYKENCVGGGSDPNAFVGADYDSQTERINFYNASGSVVDYIDASAFIVDGMIDDVYIDNGYLVIDFNTASGKQDIRIPLSDIFNPDNYYTKTDVDTKLNDYQTISGLSAVTLSTFVNDADFVTESEVDEKTTVCEYGGWYESSGAFLQGQWYALIGALNPSTIVCYFRVYLNGRLQTIGVKVSNNTIVFTDDNGTLISRPEYISSDSYFDISTNKFYVYLSDGYIDYMPNTEGRALSLAASKNCESIKEYAEGLSESISSYSGDISTISGDVSTISTALATLSGEVDTNEEVTSRALNLLNDELENKQDTLIAGDNITISGNTISATGGEIPTKLSELENDCGFVSSSVTDSLSNIIEQNELIVASALVDLDERKADVSGITDYSSAITEIQSAISAINQSISGINQTIDTKEQVIAIALNDLNTRLDGLSFVKISQTDYDDLVVKDADTVYIVIPD